MESKSAPAPDQRTASRSKRRLPGQPQNQTDAPLYLQVARTLKEEIVGGIYMVGSLLPTEEELCKRFSVSRYTVREALRLLRDDGLVTSRQGAGTVVIPPRPAGSDIHQVMSINDLLAYGAGTRLVVESIRTVQIDTKLATRTGLPVGEEWLEVCGYRHAAETETPLSRAEFYINREFAAVGRLLQHNTGSIFALIENMFGVSIAEVHQQISATLIAPALAAHLKARDGSAALEVRRTYKTADGRIAQVTINTHPAASFQHSMTMRRVKA